MSSSYRVDFSRLHFSFYETDEEKLRSAMDEKKLYSAKGVMGKEATRFFYIREVENWMKAYESRGICDEIRGWWSGEGSVTGKKWVTFLETLAKTISLVTALISVLFPFAVYFLPTWVPWGIGLPSLLLLGIAQSKLQPKIRVAKIDSQFPLFLRGMVYSHSLSSLHPYGIWDLPQLDPRLKSDLLRPPAFQQSAVRIEEVIGAKSREGLKHDLPDIDLTFSVQQFAATEFAQSYILASREALIRERRAQLTEALRRDDVQAFEENMDKMMVAITYNPYYVLDCPPTSPENHIHSTILLYHAFCKRLKVVNRLRKEGEDLYQIYPFLKEEERLYLPWERLLEKAEGVKNQIDPLISFCEKKKRSEEECVQLCVDLEKNHLRFQLFKLIDESQQIQTRLKGWIAEYPFTRTQFIRNEFMKLKEHDLSDISMKALEVLNRDPNKANQKVADIKGYPQEVLDWIKRHPSCHSIKSSELLERILAIKNAFKKAEKKLDAIGGQVYSISNQEEYVAFKHGLKNFEKEHFLPLQFLIAKQGETSRCRMFFRGVTSGKQPEPFIREPLPEQPYLRRRKIEELHLDRLLKEVDQRIVRAERGKSWGLRIPIYVLLAAEGILALYFTSPWIFCAFCIATLIAEGISLYIEHRLSFMEEEKTGIKLQYLLRNRPNIRSIPGNAPKLAQVSKVQGKYGLDNVEGIWARSGTITYPFKPWERKDRKPRDQSPYEKRVIAMNKAEVLLDSIVTKKIHYQWIVDDLTEKEDRFDRLKKILGEERIQTKVEISDIETCKNQREARLLRRLQWLQNNEDYKSPEHVQSQLNFYNKKIECKRKEERSADAQYLLLKKQVAVLSEFMTPKTIE